VFTKRQRNALDPPALASAPEAREILRVWVTPQWQRMEVALTLGHSDPSVWGIALADIARHAAKAYALNSKMSENEALTRIKQVFDAEWSSPTELPEGRLRD
jgi:hypothetical protein